MADMIIDPIYSLYKDQPIYRDLLKDFVECLDERLVLSSKALEGQDWKDLSRLMHQLKGAAATYGFPGLAALAGIIELDSATESIEEAKIRASFQEVALTCKKIEAGMAQLLED
ncbi:MAG: Hpt domain-containing protein [Chitinophagaceae bacterium]|nr:Hpt domain-containing protein [Oligoflexus sp.]